MHARINGKEVQDYWKQKQELTDEQWDGNNNRAFEVAMSERSVGKKRFFMKFFTGHNACGRMMLRRKHWGHSRCPRCGEEDEHNCHVCKCLDPDARKQWDTTVNGAEKWMKENDTHPTIIAFLVQHLNSWVEDKPYSRTPCSLSNEDLIAAMQAQNDMGAWSTLMGRINTDFEHVQTHHYKTIKSRRSGFRWTVELIKKLMDVSWDMWDHRNGILHADPERHHRATELEEANASIETEWTRGSTGLLQQDLFLFRDRIAVNNRTLARKIEWLDAVSTARDAAAEANRANQSYQQEREGMANWIIRNNGNNKRRRRDNGSNKRRRIEEPEA